MAILTKVPPYLEVPFFQREMRYSDSQVAAAVDAFFMCVREPMIEYGDPAKCSDASHECQVNLGCIDRHVVELYVNVSLVQCLIDALNSHPRAGPMERRTFPKHAVKRQADGSAGNHESVSYA